MILLTWGISKSQGYKYNEKKVDPSPLELTRDQQLESSIKECKSIYVTGSRNPLQKLIIDGYISFYS